MLAQKTLLHRQRMAWSFRTALILLAARSNIEHCDLPCRVHGENSHIDQVQDRNDKGEHMEHIQSQGKLHCCILQYI